MKRSVIGIAGRSGSGKSTLVSHLLEHYGPQKITLHTMDNYYVPRSQQKKDDNDYLNFDLPTSFYREDFHDDLISLMKGEPIKIKEYSFNKTSEDNVIKTSPAKVILVEGLFVFHYDEIRDNMDLKVMVDISMEEAFRRRLLRDQRERNYEEEEIRYRYLNHVEPSYQKFIHPHMTNVDMTIDNERGQQIDSAELISYIDKLV